MTDISRYIYQYMCNEIVGSQRVVRYRRRFLEVFEFVHNNCLSPSKYLVVSGSKAEGLDLAESDLDIMLISNRYSVYESKSKMSSVLLSDIQIRQILQIDTDNAQPGFVLLRVHNELFCDQTFFERNGDGTYFSSKRYLSNLGSKYTRNKINGPCLSNLDGKLDVAHSLKCSEWPSVAKDWATRKRSSGWPSVFLVSDIVTHGVLLVPIGSKSRSDHVHPLEWRISFSVSEKLLINSWTHTQLLCYAMLKVLLNEVIKNKNGHDCFLCSYFLKTTLFWLSDEVDMRKWTANRLLDCFVMCLCRLTYWITQKYIPNYFIPEHNMIDRLHDQQSWDELLALMSFLHGIGWQSILLCESFQVLKICQHLNDLPLKGLGDFEKAVVPLINILNLNLQDVTYGSRNKAFSKCGSFIIKKKIPKKYRIMFLIVLSSMSLKRSESLLRQKQWNKLYYSKHKEEISCYLISAHSCVATGWALIALNLYLCGQYQIVLKILKFAMSVCSSDQFIISPEDFHIPSFQDLCRYMSTSTFSYLKKIKYQTRYKCIIIDTLESIDYLLQPNPQSDGFTFETPFSLYYLRFACYHRLKNVDGIQQCLNDLKMFLEKEATDSIGITLNKLHHSILSFAYQITFDENMEHYLIFLHSKHKRSHLY
ncbi:Hypothetical predicted protein [Mytilus galloprovincialis]|uniref:Mab-21-like HhH/H2TH-like domain-containing protein n=1 Tax=Mytilus galloprovincialis TaxID=29158 RepID=A0A8B6DT82_MYTGA|nr:Hypothetical predicted protein [Mytilus galloprovincialis]